MLDSNYLTPRQIVSELDKYIIGQAGAKKNVAIALRNRWRRMHVQSDMQKEIVPNNILMIGATGVGKTEIARRLAKIADAPFTKVEASKFTEVGYVGRDVESMVRDLVEQSVNLVRQSKKESVREKAEKTVEELILDELIPLPTPSEEDAEDTPNFKGKQMLRIPNDVQLSEEEMKAAILHTLKSLGKTGAEVKVTKIELQNEQKDNSEQQKDNSELSDEEMTLKAREYLRVKLRAGEIDERKIEITVQTASGHGAGIIGGGMMDEASMANLQDMLSNMMPKKDKKRKVTVREAKKLLLEEESAKLIDMDEVKEEAIHKAENTGIIFIDEIDKIAVGSAKGGGPDVSREGVQRDLLPIVEGSAVNTKYGVINTDHILFVAAGAFHVAKPSDMIPELQGRFPIRVELDNLTKDDFYQILKEPKNALTKQYEALLEVEDVALTFTDEAMLELADLAFRINQEVENIGARRLHTVMSQLLNGILFDVPDEIPQNAKISITAEMVKEQLADLVQNKNLSEFIL